MSLEYVAGMVFISMVMLVLGLYNWKSSGGQEYSRRMSRILKRQPGPGEEGGVRRSKGAGSGAYRFLVAMLSATPLKNRVEKELARADLPVRGEEFMAFSVIGIGVVVLVVMVVTTDILPVLVTLLLMLPLPYLFIQRAKHRRLAMFNSQIGDALVIIANSMRSGFSFLQAMDLVRKEMPDPIAREFARTFQEINLGTHTEQALVNMAERVGSDDLDMVVTAVLIQRQVGGNLAEVLDKIAHTIRERIRIKGEIKTLTAQGRISGLIVGFLPAALAGILFLINPGYISLLFTTVPGLVMVVAAIVAQVTGFFIIRRIVDIKY